MAYALGREIRRRGTQLLQPHGLEGLEDALRRECRTFSLHDLLADQLLQRRPLERASEGEGGVSKYPKAARYWTRYLQEGGTTKARRRWLAASTH